MKLRKNFAKLGKTLLVMSALALSTTNLLGTAEAAEATKNVEPAQIVKNLELAGSAIFPIGEPNTGYAKYFTGESFLYRVSNDGLSVSNVTFAPSCINFWHKHHGGCQVLAGVSGKGYYQIWGEEVQELLPGQSVTIPENVKHWHGAQHDSWFQHLSIMREGVSTEWLEPVDEAAYKNLKQ